MRYKKIILPKFIYVFLYQLNCIIVLLFKKMKKKNYLCPILALFIYLYLYSAFLALTIWAKVLSYGETSILTTVDWGI